MRVVSTRTHTVVGLIVGVVLIFAPNIFGFSDVGGAAVTIPRVIGILLLLSELMTNNGLSPVKLIPMKVHLMGDLLAGLLLALSPWLFGFSDQGTNAWVPHLVVGLAVAGYSLITKTTPDNNAANS
jgi:hypothetical protein